MEVGWLEMAPEGKGISPESRERTYDFFEEA